MELPVEARRLVEQAEEAEAAGRTSQALELYNSGLALAMEHLPRQPELKLTIESYLCRAMKLQQPAADQTPGKAAAIASPELAVGERCKVETKEPDGGFGRRVGTVAFAGPTVLGDGLWIGVTLDERVSGRHDGAVSGVRYFRCPPERGVLVRASRVEPLLAGAASPVAVTNRSAVPDGTPAQRARLELATEENDRRRRQRRKPPRATPRRGASPSRAEAAQRRGSTASSTATATAAAASFHSTTTTATGISAQHRGSPPRWGSPVSSRRGSVAASAEPAAASATAGRGDEVRSEMEEELSQLRVELAAAERSILEMARERDEVLEALGTAQGALSAGGGASGGGAVPAGPSNAVARERDRLKSRVGLLTGERDSLRRQLAAAQRKLGRRSAAVERTYTSNAAVAGDFWVYC